MARSALEDPLKVFRFTLSIAGVQRAGFMEVTGLEAETEEVPYREGGMNETPQKSAGLSKFNDVVLKRGQIIGSSRGGDNDLYNWYQLVNAATAQGNNVNYRKDVTITQFDATNSPVLQWVVTNCWPKRYKAFGDLNGNGNDNSIEELTLSQEGFEQQASS